MTATKAELEAKVADLEAKVTALEAERDALKDDLDELKDVLLVKLEAHDSGANTADASSDASADEQVTVIAPTDGVVVLGDAHTIDQHWTHPSRATRGFAVDVAGEGAEGVARRLIPNKHAADGIQQLADGTWRVKCTDHRQAQLVFALARRHIATNEMQGITAKVSSLGGTSVQALDATRERGLGLAPGGLLAIACKSIVVTRKANGSLVLTPA
jgi:hypothetical protein